MKRSIKRTVDGKDKDCYADFGWVVSAIKLTPPKKKKVLEDVPYRSGSYDFSELYGVQAYADREMTITFAKELPVTHEDGQLQEFVNWLYSGGRSPMWEAGDAQWYYNAECTAVDISDGLAVMQEVTATFIADPFRWKFGIPNMEWIDIPDDESVHTFANSSPGAIPVQMTIDAKEHITFSAWVESLAVPKDYVGLGKPAYTFSSSARIMKTIIIPPGGCYMKFKRTNEAGEATVTLMWRDQSI